MYSKTIAQENVKQPIKALKQINWHFLYIAVLKFLMYLEYIAICNHKSSYELTVRLNTMSLFLEQCISITLSFYSVTYNHI